MYRDIDGTSDSSRAEVVSSGDGGTAGSGRRGNLGPGLTAIRPGLKNHAVQALCRPGAARSILMPASPAGTSEQTHSGRTRDSRSGTRSADLRPPLSAHRANGAHPAAHGD